MRNYSQEWARRKANLEAKYPARAELDLAPYEAWTGEQIREATVSDIPRVIWALSDTHVGARTFTANTFKRHKARADEVGAVILFGGDAIECVSFSSSVNAMGAGYEQYLPPDGSHPLNFQVDAFEQYIGDTPVLGMVEGNHEARLSRQGFNPVEELCKRFGAIYLGVLGIVRLGEASILVSHGEGSGNRHHYNRMRDFPGHDAYLGGHTHQLGVEASGKALLVRTGHYIGQPSYGLRQQYSSPPAPPGSVLLFLDENGRVVNAEILR